MQIFMKIDRKKTGLYSFESSVHCFWVRLYIRVVPRILQILIVPEMFFFKS